MLAQVHAGPLYTAQRGDTLLSIAAMAKTTVKTILQVD
jgi:LysM repeat protein